jgi:predicted GNAT superfamily acetyltransferase
VTTTQAPSRAVVQAVDSAREVAARRGLAVRELSSPAELHRAARLLAEVWPDSASGTLPVTAETMRTLSFIGSYVAAAFAADRMVGVGVGMLAEPDSSGTGHLHSHIVGVAPDARGANVGFAIKLHQRGWCLSRDIGDISWTFDPLVRRNACFNLAKLAATASRYLVDFYGDMADEVNAGQGSDRLLATWRLASTQVRSAAAGTRLVPDAEVLQRASPLVLLDPQQAPVPVELAGPGPYSVAVPEDIETLRRRDPELSRAWRAAVREKLGAAFESGFHITGFSLNGGYLLEERQDGSES